MRKIVLISFLITFFNATFILSQTNENMADGYKVFKYPNGTVSSEGNIRNGKPDGLWKSFYITGVKKSEGKRTNFLLDSVWVFFDQTGDTTEKINYLFAKKNGYYFKYKKDPAEGLYIWSKELFAGDKKEGTAYTYFPDHKVKQTIAYNNGKKEGLSKEFDKEGNVISLMEYSNDFLVSREKINRIDNNGMKQGDWKEFYPGGGIKSEKTFKDDQLNGYFKEYDIKGNLILTMLYENGSIVKSNVEDQPDIEIVNKYDPSGKLIFSGPYRNQVPVGIHRDYGPDGKILNSKIYNDNGLLISEGLVDEAGNRNGKWKDFYPSGKIQAEGQYSDNRKSGLWKFYNEFGKGEQTGYFNNGRPDGLWKWYYDNGSLLREEEYFQGQRDGAYTEYSITGEIIAQGQYSDGEKNGEWKYKSGNNIESGKYIIGLRDGQWKSYYPDDKLRFKGNFIQGNADGPHVYYYENGKIKEERYYQMGIREKTWKKFDENGTLLLSIAYKNDVEISINGVKIKLPESDVKLIK
jgi:antitoxin component YwqK of YwqJK toxin-antitoxin module